jgi:hypothetical protein
VIEQIKMLITSRIKSSLLRRERLAVMYLHAGSAQRTHPYTPLKRGIAQTGFLLIPFFTPISLF